MEKDNLTVAMYDYGERMNWKINAFLSMGALFPFFIVSLIGSIFVLRQLPFMLPVIFLFMISLFVNLYAVKVLKGKEKFNPKLMKIVSIDKAKKSENWLTPISIFISLLPLLLAIPRFSQTDILVIILAVSTVLILFYTIYEQESSVSQILSIRVLFRSFYIAKTDTSSTVFLISREKLQADRKIRAYHVTDDVYIFGERTNN